MNNIQITDNQIKASEDMRLKEQSLQDVLRPYWRYGLRNYFPGCTGIMGLCTDGRTFNIDLLNKKLGNIMIVGDEPGTTNLLNTMCRTTCAFNSKQDVGFHIISTNPDKFNSTYPSHILGIHSPYDRRTGELIIELGSQVKQRRNGRELGSVKVLIIDDLNSLRDMLSDYSVELNLTSLVKKGSCSNIWVMISIRRQDVVAEDQEFFKSFRFFIEQNPEYRYRHPPSLFTVRDGIRRFHIVTLS